VLSILLLLFCSSVASLKGRVLIVLKAQIVFLYNNVFVCVYVLFLNDRFIIGCWVTWFCRCLIVDCFFSFVALFHSGVTMASSHLQWMVIRNTSSFLIKRNKQTYSTVSHCSSATHCWCDWHFGIIKHKMKILSLITDPHVVPNP